MIRIYPELVVPFIQNNNISIVKEQKYKKVEEVYSPSKSKNENMTEQKQNKKRRNNTFDNMLHHEIDKLI